MRHRPGNKGRLMRILSTLITLLIFSTIITLIIAVSEIHWLINYTPREQYSTDVHRCTPKDLNISISQWHMRSIQPNNSAVILTNREILGNQGPENLTQKQWLENAEVIFNWISSNIDYKNTEHIFPQLPNESIKTRSGDCDDLALLYTSMAINAGVPPENIRLVIARERFIGNTFTCEPTHMYVELKYVHEGKTIWMPIELTNKESRFNQFITTLYLPGVRFYWLSYRDYGYFDDRNIEKDTSYETKIRLLKAYTEDSLGIEDLKEILAHALNRHQNMIF
jgi:hypothetical protein